MDYSKIGGFIAREREDRLLTQAELARQLYVSEKTVSKWETGRGLPDTSLLPRLCDILNISVNELLCGERLDAPAYKAKAEDNLAALLRQRKSNKRKLLWSSACCLLDFSVLLVMTMLAGFLDIPAWLRICLIAYGLLISVSGVGIAVFFDLHVGSFACRYCGKTFIPSAKAYVFSLHTLTARRLTCPHCGKTGLCKKKSRNKDA